MSETRYPVWAQDKPVIEDSQITETTTADVVIVGSGNAGLLAASPRAENNDAALRLLRDPVQRQRTSCLGQLVQIRSRSYSGLCIF